MKDPCKDCPDKRLDDYGYVCNISCEKRSAWLNYQAGIKEVVEWVEANLQYPTRGEGLVLKRNMEWQSKLKEWGIE